MLRVWSYRCHRRFGEVHIRRNFRLVSIVLIMITVYLLLVYTLSAFELHFILHVSGVKCIPHRVWFKPYNHLK